MARVDMSDVHVEKSLERNFDATLRRKLDPQWHRIGKKGRQLYNDVRILRRLLAVLLERDCAFFLNLVDNVKAECAGGGGLNAAPSLWLLTDAAEKLFMHAKARVYTVLKDRQMKSRNVAIHLEPCAKRDLLFRVIKEALPRGRVLVLIDTHHSLEYIKDHLEFSARAASPRNQGGKLEESSEGAPQLAGYEQRVPPMLLQSFFRFLSKRADCTDDGTSAAKETSERSILAKEYHRLACLHTTGNIELPGDIAQSKSRDSDDPAATFYSSEQNDQKAPSKDGAIHIPGASSPSVRSVKGMEGVHLYAMKGRSARESSMTSGVLEALLPTTVILYDHSVAAVREIEIYEAERASRDSKSDQYSTTKVFFVLYGGSVEEQRYLFALRKEVDAFERLVKQKASMAIPEDLAEPTTLAEPQRQRVIGYNISSGAALLAAARKSSAAASVVHRVIVDMREFRSALPFMLYRQGIRVCPRTLEVGDYILSPKTCVERKSIPDLIGSLNSGRLFKQAQAMCRAYENPAVLIEFAKDRPFSLQAATELTGEIAPKSVLSKLVLLTLHFPRLRLLWSKSPHDTVSLFKTVKQHRPQPDPKTASEITAGGSSVEDESHPLSYTSGATLTAREALRRLPGVEPSNFHKIRSSVGSLQELTTLSLDALTALMGPRNASRLFDFINKTVNTDAALLALC